MSSPFSFQPQDLKLKMSHSSESEMKNLQSSLDAAKIAASADLQRTVIKKYTLPIQLVYCSLLSLAMQSSFL